jgi:hypothetical protein
MTNNSEKFATSLISLALVRNGYETFKDVPGGGEHRTAILVVGKGAEKKTEETFIVEVKVIRDENSIPRQLDNLRDQYRSALANTVYLAFFIDSEGRLIVDDALCQRMRFVDDEIRLETLPRISSVAAS